jgi:hypothetical protein
MNPIPFDLNQTGSFMTKSVFHFIYYKFFCIFVGFLNF